MSVAAQVTWAGSDAVGRPLFALRNTPRPLVQSLRDALLLEGRPLVYGGTSLYGGRPPETFFPRVATRWPNFYKL